MKNIDLNGVLFVPLALSGYSILSPIFTDVELLHTPYATGLSVGEALSFTSFVALFLCASKKSLISKSLSIFLALTVVGPIFRLLSLFGLAGLVLPQSYLVIANQIAVGTAITFLLLTIWAFLGLRQINKMQILRMLLLIAVFVLVAKNWVFLGFQAISLKEKSIFNLMSLQATIGFSCLLLVIGQREFKKITLANQIEKWTYLRNLRISLNATAILSVMFGAWLFTDARESFSAVNESFEGVDNATTILTNMQIYYVNSVVIVMLLLAMTIVLIALQKFSAELERENRRIIESEFKYFSEVYKSSPDATVTTNAMGVIEDVNDQFETIFGWSKEEIIGNNLGLVIPERFRLSHARSVQNYAKNPYRRPMGQGLILFGLRKSGEEFPVEISLGSVFHNDKTYLLATVRDVSAQKQVEEKISVLNKTLEGKVIELEQANQEMKSFAYAISHDLRAPLRAIVGFSQIIQEDHLASVKPELNNLLKRVIDSAAKMGMQIDGLLQLSRLSQKKIQKDNVSLSSLAEDLVSMLIDRPKKEKYEVQIEANMQAYCDLVLMRICLQNFLENAIKFSSKVEKPKIKFYLSDPQKQVFCIEDNGVGFDSKKASKLFTIFHRLHVENDFPGLGIGLATVKKIIEIQNGKIWVESKLGQGTKFYFTFS